MTILIGCVLNSIMICNDNFLKQMAIVKVFCNETLNKPINRQMNTFRTSVYHWTVWYVIQSMY